MDWLPPALVATAATTFFVSLIYFYLFLQEREKSLAVWAVGWVFYGCRFLIHLGLVLEVIPRWMIHLQQFSSVAGAVLFAWGTCIFIGRKFSRLWLLAAAAGIAWTPLATACNASFLVVDLPVSFFIGFAYAWSGYLLLRDANRKSAAGRVTGWALIFWGVHKADYPFLRPLLWFAPWGYLLASMLFLLGSIGILLVYYERIRRNLLAEIQEREKSEKRFRSVIESTADGIVITDRAGRIALANSGAEKMFGYGSGELAGLSLQNLLAAGDGEEAPALFSGPGGSPVPGETRGLLGLRKDGSRFPLDCNISTWPQGEEILFSGILRDTTEQKNMLKSLENSKALLTSLIDSIPDLIFYKDKQSVYLGCNQAFTAFAGWDEEKLIGHTDYDFFSREVADFFRARDREMLEQGAPRRNEEWVTYPSGKRVLLDTLKTPYYDPEGHVLGLIGISRDITERKIAEEALQESEERFRAIFEQAAVGVALINSATGRFIKVNQKYCNIVGYSPAELQELSVRDITHPDDLVQDRVYMERLASGEIREFALEKRYVHKQGRIIRIMLTVSSLGIEGRPDYHIAVVEDITDAREALEALNKSESLLNEVGEIARIGGWEMDLITRQAKWTRVVHDIFEIEPGQPIPGADEHLACYLPEYRPMIEKAVQNLIDHDAPLEFEAEIRTAKGNIKWCRALGKSVRRDGKCLKIYGTFQDISREKKAAAEKEALEKKFRQAQKMEAIGTLAGGIAHDFNNILVPIIGYTEMVIDALPTDSQNRQDLREVLTAANRAKELVKQILRFSREREQEMVPLLIAPIVKESIKLLSSSIPKNIQIRRNISTKALTVLADASQIHQIMMNLGTNAYQAMRDQGGILDISLAEADADDLPLERALAVADGQYLEIMVRDTGKGMDAQTRERIFEPYFTTREKEDGTGLGLAVVHGIVSTLKGKIFVESEPGRGSSFYIYLPLFSTPFQEEEKETNQICPTGTERILVVDDEKGITETIARRLTGLGYQVTTRTSSVEALELFRHKPDAFDLVLTDQTMPNMTGDQLAVELLAIRPDIPLILCTGYSSVMDPDRARELGIKAFLLKPVIRYEMARAIRTVLDGRANGPQTT
jgi:PAS domain S-box-containing protein